MAKVLTARTVETLKPTDRRQEIADKAIPGLFLLVQPSGKRSYAVRCRINGKTAKITLGPVPLLSLAEARDKARSVLRDISEGLDPRVTKTDAKGEETVGAAVERYLSQPKQSQRRTARETRRIFDKQVLPHWHGRPIAGIRRTDVHRLIDPLVDRGHPHTANKLLATLRAFFRWALSRDFITAAPTDGVIAPDIPGARDHTLTLTEIRAIMKACEDLTVFGAQVQVLVLTAQRRTEVAQMRWSEIDEAQKLWHLPKERTKNKRAHTVPLSDPVLAILRAQRRFENCDLVFTNDAKTPAGNYGKNKAALDALLPDVRPWRLHDLRRSAVTEMARLGVQIAVIERVVNHISGTFRGVVGVYQRYDFQDECREALDKWAAFVVGADNVLPMKRTG